MPSVLYIAVNEYAEETDPLATRAVGRPVHRSKSSLQRDVLAGWQPPVHQVQTRPWPWPPRKGSHWQSDLELEPAFSSTSGDSFKLGRGLRGGIPFMQPEPPSRNQNAANTESRWRRLGYSQALRTSNWCQKKSSSAPCGKQRALKHLQLTQISCENAWQKLQRVMSTGNKGDVHTSFCMCRQGRKGWQVMLSCRNTFVI